MSGQWPAAGWGQRNEDHPDAASPEAGAAVPEAAPVDDAPMSVGETVEAEAQTVPDVAEPAEAPVPIEAVTDATDASEAAEAPEPTIAAAPDSAAEAVDAVPVAENVSPPDDAPAQVVADAPASNDEPAIAADTSGVAADASAGHAEPGSSFLDELVRAMRATAAVERARLAGDIDRRRETHIQGIQARAQSEVERMRDLAAEDMRSIQVWADGETKRIQAERKRRETELNEDLETSLAEHRSMIDREIDRIEGAIAAYRTEMEAFFDGLDHETDPILIASQATRHPAFPSLDIEGDEAGPSPAAAAPPDGPLVGVMGQPGAAASQQPAAGLPAAPVAETQGAESEAAAVDAVAAPDQPAAGESASGDGGAESEPVGAAAGSARVASSVLESIPVVRPLGWLRRDANGSDHSSHEG
jgi:hypothetical protein